MCSERCPIASWQRYLSPSHYLTPHTLLTNATNKFITFIALIIVEIVIHELWYMVMYGISVTQGAWAEVTDAAAIHHDAMAWMAVAGLVMLLLSAVTIPVIRRLAVKSPLWYACQAVYIASYYVYGLLLAIFIGQNTAVIGMTILSGLVFGLLFVHQRFVIVAYLLCMVSFGFLMLNLEYQWIEVLPSFYTFHYADEHEVWSWSYIYLCVAKSWLTIYMVSMMLKLLRLQQQQIRTMLESDPLTSVFNRRNLHYYFNFLWQYPKDWHEISAVYLDIDNFKYINDTYGHEVGDATLLLVVEAIRQVIDGQFYLCRHGGEEFLIIMANTPLATATAIAEQIRVTISEKQFDHIQPCDQPITASFGVSGLRRANQNEPAKAPPISYDEFVESLETKNELTSLPPAVTTLLKIVDSAMQTAKRQGRNCVVTLPVSLLDDQCEIIPAK